MSQRPQSEWDHFLRHDLPVLLERRRLIREHRLGDGMYLLSYYRTSEDFDIWLSRVPARSLMSIRGRESEPFPAARF